MALKGSERVKRPRATVAAILALLAALVLVPLVLAPRTEAFVYWTNENGIGRANLDGTGIADSFIDVGRDATSVAVDDNYIYWRWESPPPFRGAVGRAPPRALGAIGRARLDGTDIDENFISGVDVNPGRLAVDANHIYWIQYIGPPGLARTSIARANLDGTDVQTEFISQGAYGVAVDDHYIYWTGGDSIGRAKVDGTEVDPDFISPPRTTRVPDGCGKRGRGRCRTRLLDRCSSTDGWPRQPRRHGHRHELHRRLERQEFACPLGCRGRCCPPVLGKFNDQ